MGDPTKETFRKVFMMLTAIQAQFQNPLIKDVLEFMSHSKLIKGKRLRPTDEFLRDIPVSVRELIKKHFPDQ